MSADPDRSSGSSMSQINVTPLVDVMLVLLVIFMVTAPILQQGVSLELPAVRTAALAPEEPPLIVSVTERGAVYLGDEALLLTDLARELAEVARETPERPVFVRGDARVSYGEVLQVMSTVKSAGIQRVGMVTRPPQPAT